jgi:hypothetical protein
MSAQLPDVKWSLFNVDTFDILEGQFPLLDASQNAAAHYEHAWAMNRSEPITQWLHGNLTSWTFNTVLRSTSGIDDISSKVDWLLSCVRKQDKLGRPPLFVWTWGTIQLTCVITSIGGVKWEMQPTGPNGTPVPRQVNFALTLEKYTQFDLKVTDPNASPFDTLYINVKLGATYESIAADRYGDALWGDLIRRRHPTAPYPLAGAVVGLPEEDTLLEESLDPESAPLQRTAECLLALQSLYALRGGSKVSHVF